MNINVRLRKNNFSSIAGEYFLDPNSEFILELNKKGIDAIVGIKQNGLYTIIGHQFTFYKSSNGEEGKIINTDLIEILGGHGMRVGKTAEFEFIEIKKDTFVWFGNVNIMSVFLNTLLFVSKN